MTVFADPEGLPDADRLYKFNIIGVDNVKDVDMTEDNGKRMFVLLNDKTKINLVQAMEDDEPMAYDAPGAFDILDANGTDGEATFQMPAPGLEPYVVGEKTDEDCWSDYSIYIRSLGKPEGWASITTCAELADETALLNMIDGVNANKIIKNMQDGDAYCSIEQVGQSITERPKGKSIFTNVTAELTTIVFQIEIDLDASGIIEADEIFFVRVPIFDDMLENEFWSYDNHGLKLLQVWIYDYSTDVSLGDGDLVPLP
jgi:hypothetical protein